MAACSFNVCSLLKAGRVHSVSCEFERIHLVGLQATRIRRHAWDSDHNVFSTEYHVVINCGYGRGAFTNKSCGVSFMLTRKWFSKNSVLHFFKVPANLQGRCAAILVKFFGDRLFIENAVFKQTVQTKTYVLFNRKSKALVSFRPAL